LFLVLPANREIFDPPGRRPQDHYLFLGADLVNSSVGALPGEDPRLAVIQGFDVEQRFDLKLLGLLNVKYLLSEFPLRGASLELVHAPSLAPVRPYSRDWATGLISPPSGPRGRGAREKLVNGLSDLLAAVRSKSQGKDIFIYELKTWIPRYRLVRSMIAEPDGRGVLDRLASLDAKLLADTVVLESKDANSLSLSGTLGRGSIRLLRYEASVVELEVATDGEGALVVGQSWNPYWRAIVDGKERIIVRANHAQLAVPIRPNDRIVTLVYRPPYSVARFTLTGGQ
jgi:hypothetical protein